MPEQARRFLETTAVIRMAGMTLLLVGFPSLECCHKLRFVGLKHSKRSCQTIGWAENLVFISPNSHLNLDNGGWPVDLEVPSLQAKLYESQ